MLVYLLQVTLIWAISAMLYEALLIHETSHRLNRAYLLGTLLLGLLSPLISLGNNPIPVAAIMDHPIQNYPALTTAFSDYTNQSSAVAKAISTPAQIPWLLLIYCAGCAIMLGRLIAGLYKLIRLYHGGTKHCISGYRFIETGGEHGPFSFFHHVYIGRLADFDNEDLKLIAAHEMRHARYLHGLDILITETLKILLWMHPLVYWYGSRLRRLHEYEADAAAKETPGRYGKLLLNQMLLSEGPCMTHSFYHAPIRLRLKMITKGPGRTPLLKYAFLVPLLCAVMIGCMKDRPAEDLAVKQGNKIFFKGNELELGQLSPMEIMKRFQDTTHHVQNHIGPYPVKLNGQRIYEEWDLTTLPAYQGKYTDASSYLFARLQDLLNGLPDGTYVLPLRNVIVDEKGKLAYYQGSGLFPLPNNREQPKPDTPNASFFCVDGHPIIGNNCPDFPKVDSNLSNAITRKTLSILDEGISFSPATIKGRPVPAYLSKDLHIEYYKVIQVKDHHAVLVGNH